jgi:hypothetical protein
MTTVLTLWIAGMPLSAITLMWALWEVPDDDWRELFTLPGLAALLVWVVLWPVFLVLILWEQFLDQEGSE